MGMDKEDIKDEDSTLVYPVEGDINIGGGHPDFKDAQGRFRTLSLFYESKHPSYPSYFTTKKYDHKGHVSLYKLYMEISDPTEYRVAMEVFNSWDHWKALCSSEWFTGLVSQWREELKVKIESERYQEMRALAKSGSPQAATASRWLAERYGEKKRGRPSKAEVEGRLSQETRETKAILEDAANIGL